MGLVKNNALADDPFFDASAAETVPPAGPVIVSLAQWQAQREGLLARGAPVGVRLHSDQSPELIADDLEHLAVVALEFPKFRDGRAYSYARLLRERYGYRGRVARSRRCAARASVFHAANGLRRVRHSGP